MGRLPFGGQAWIDMQYLAGLRKLGHDVYYLEECGQESWVYNWETGQETNDIRYPAGYVRHCLEPLGMEYKWIYRAGQQAEGMPIDSFSDLCAEADLLLIRAVPLQAWRREYTLPRHTAFIDADPGFTQMNLLQGHEALAATVEHSGTLFTVGQRLG